MREVQGLQGLAELRPVWETALPPFPSPMQSYEWVRSWAEVYRGDRELRILVAENGSGAAIAPLVRTSRDVGRFELAGPAELGEAMDVVCADPDQLPDLTAGLARSGVPLRFWRVPADSPVIAALKASYRGRGLVRCEPGVPCPSISLDPTWADPERHLDKKRWANLRRARKIAESLGGITIEIHAPQPADIDALLREAYSVEADGWKSRHGEPLVREALEGEFWRRYATAASEKGIFRIAFLRIGGRAAAMKLAVVTGGRFWLLKMGYSEEFARCSPGAILLYETIRYAARSGLRSYEFLGSDEPWIRAWEDRVLRPCVTIRTYPLSAKGLAALNSDAGAHVRGGARGLARAAEDRAQRAIERRAARRYVAGPGYADALRVCGELSARGFRSTIGYVDAEGDSPQTVAAGYLRAIDEIAARGLDCYASMKAPVLRFSRHVLGEIVTRARLRGVGIHFDTLGVEDADETFAAIRDLRSTYDRIGCTLPGRWRRSLDDAERAIELDVSVRVVKGEFPEPDSRGGDSTSGSLAVIDRLAGRARHVSVATHNPTLARAAIRRLRAAGTSCDLEVLLGYPIRRILPVAESEGVPVRVYVPYGHMELPYTIGKVFRNRRIAGWALRDLVLGNRARLPRIGVVIAAKSGRDEAAPGEHRPPPEGEPTSP